MKRTVLSTLALLGFLLAPLAGKAAAGNTDAPVVCNDVLINGGFESGSAGWTQSSAGGFDLISQYNPRSGAWGAYLAGYDNTDDRLRQPLPLPAGTISATLRLWWSLETEEPALANDDLTVSLLSADGTTLAELWMVDNTAPAGQWAEAVIDLTGYAGQDVTLQLRATTNAYDLTDFYMDDLSVLVCIPASLPQRSYLPLVVHS